MKDTSHLNIIINQANEAQLGTNILEIKSQIQNYILASKKLDRGKSTMVKTAELWVVKAWRSEDVALYRKVVSPPLLIANSI